MNSWWQWKGQLVEHTLVGTERGLWSIEGDEKGSVALRYKTKTCQRHWFTESGRIGLKKKFEKIQKKKSLHLGKLGLTLNPWQALLHCIVESRKIWVVGTIIILIWEELESSISNLWDVNNIFRVYAWRTIEGRSYTLIELTFCCCKKK